MSVRVRYISLSRVHCAVLNGTTRTLWLTSSQCYGGHGERETPGLIPNPEAKPLSADGTAPGTGWESRTPPDNHSQRGSEPSALAPVDACPAGPTPCPNCSLYEKVCIHHDGPPTRTRRGTTPPKVRNWQFLGCRPIRGSTQWCRRLGAFWSASLGCSARECSARLEPGPPGPAAG